MRAFLFPGQGSQVVGMGKALADASAHAREIFEEVDDALQQKLSRLMFEGPSEDLTLTANAQPAIMAVSIAALRVLERDGGVKLVDAADYVAGHSLGEYSALCAAGALSLADTARLLRLRGDAMQKAVPVGEGAMAALLGLDVADAEAATSEASEGEVCAVANDNAPGQVVISGAKGAVDRAIEAAKARGAKRAMALAVSAPFHCALMQPAADAMADALSKVTIRAPLLPLVANVTAEPVSDAATIRSQLVAQVTGRVRWRESMNRLVDLGVTAVVEIGAGKVLTGMLKRAHPDVTLTNIETAEDAEAFVKTL